MFSRENFSVLMQFKNVFLKNEAEKQKERKGLTRHKLTPGAKLTVERRWKIEGAEGLNSP